MLIETLSVFPEMFEPVMSTSILGRARKAGLFDFKAYNLRDWTHDRHRTVDDEPYGGGQGMLMKVEPIAEAIEAISAEGPKPTVVFFTPCGEPFTQHVAERLLKSERLLFVCSRYEGVDERAYAYADERLSIGDYVLTGGELPAMVVADAVVRLIPGALGDEAPMAAAAVPEALDRLQILQRPLPPERDIHTAPIEPWAGLRLRVGRGPEVNGYVGATLSLESRSAVQGPWSYHLLLVQAVAQGTEGSPMPRHVVRNAVQGRWTADNALPTSRRPHWIEVRPMRLPEGADPALFYTVGWVQDRSGRMVVAARSVCH